MKKLGASLLLAGMIVGLGAAAPASAADSASDTTVVKPFVGYWPHPK